MSDLGQRRRTAAVLTLPILIGASACDGAAEPDPVIEEIGVIGEDASRATDHSDADHLDERADRRDADPDLTAELQRLEARYAEAVAARLEHGRVTEEVQDAVAAAFAPQLAEAIIAALEKFDDELAVFRPADELGPRVHTDVEVLERTEDCVHLRTRVDATALVVDAPQDEPAFVVLSPAPAPAQDADASSTYDADGDSYGDDADQDPGRHWVIAQLPEGDPAELRETARC